MRYLLDANILSSQVLSSASNREDLFIIDEVADECTNNESEKLKITNAGISINHITKKHLDNLSEVMKSHGSNFKLIRLYTCKGSADVLMIAYILSEKFHPEILFSEEYTLVTKDRTLSTIAKTYGIEVTESI